MGKVRHSAAQDCGNFSWRGQTARFEYLEARTVRQAVSLLSKHGDKARIVAGATDFLIRWRQGFWNPTYVVSIKRIPGLDRVSYSPRTGLRLGALATVGTLETHPIIRRHYPALSAAASTFAGVQVRNLATVGGNVCNASPSGDTLPSLLAFEAQCRIMGPEGERWMPLDQFFLSPGRSALKPGEILTELRLPTPGLGVGSLYIKDSPRSAMDIAAVGVTSVVYLDVGGQTCRDVKIALGAVAATPMRAKTAEAVLRGKLLDQNLIDEASRAAAAESRPIDDIRGSARHRRSIVESLTRRTLQYAVRMAQKTEIPFEVQRDLAVGAGFEYMGA